LVFGRGRASEQRGTDGRVEREDDHAGEDGAETDFFSSAGKRGSGVHTLDIGR
jgi:hypothetical protein